MLSYVFQTELLSAQKTGFPNLIGTSLSGVGVNFLSGASVVFATQQVAVVSLSTNDNGVLFTPINYTPAVTSLSTFVLSTFSSVAVNILGSIVNVPALMNGATFGVVKPNRSYSVFPYLSSTATVATSALSSTRDVSTAQNRRKHLYGYH